MNIWPRLRRQWHHLLYNNHGTDVIRAYWATWGNDAAANFGDALTPWLIRRITGATPVYCRRGPVYMVTGSIIKHTTSRAIVWGCGVISAKDVPHEPPLKVCAVRGPVTRQRLLDLGIEVPEVYGDPALLLPRLYPIPPRPRYEVGVVPHFVHYDAIAARFADRPDVKVVNLLRSTEEVVDSITSCRRLISSSLHGLIVAHAYGVPCLWIKFMNSQLSGDDSKFRDYFGSVHLPMYEPPTMSIEELNLEALIPRIEDLDSALDIDLDALWQACPFRLFRTAPCHEHVILPDGTPDGCGIPPANQQKSNRLVHQCPFTR